MTVEILCDSSEITSATGARCLSGDKLALWIIEKLVGAEIAQKVYDAVKPFEEHRKI